MFKYEMHIHSSPCSGGGDDIENHIRTLIAKGYSGMVITNHFIFGDTGIDRSLPWDKFVEEYKEDYLRGRRLADELDFDLLFGIEEHIGSGREILIYGITPEFLLKNPQLRYAEAREYADAVHKVGGLVFQAHPYRDRYYIAEPGPLSELDILDGIEVFNASNKPEENKMASRLARERGLRCVAGSDGHSADSAGRSGILTTDRIRTNEQLIDVLKNGKYELYIPSEK